MIGVFDSGIGGLSVLSEIRRLSPQSDLTYIADSRFVPYGEKSDEFVTARASLLSSWLAEKGASIITVACNTATCASIDHLRAVYPLPFVGVEPAVKPAIALTKTGKIGVLATRRTLESLRYRRLCERFSNNNIRFLEVAAPELVDVVESLQIDEPQVLKAIREVVAPFVEAEDDVVVLGCTHFPFLRRQLERVVGNGIAIIDSGEAVARQVCRQVRSSPSGQGILQIFQTGESEALTRYTHALFGDQVTVERIDLGD